MRNIFCFIWCWILGICSVLSQEINPFIHHLTVEDGLLQARNDFVYKDSLGFVWISSLNGLNVYDGKIIKTYQQDFDDPQSIFGQNIQSSFFELENGDIVFTTYEGINIYRRSDNKFEHVIVPGDLKFYFAFHLDPDGHLWFVNDGAYLYTIDLSTLETNKKDSFPSKVHRVSPLADAKGFLAELWAYSYQDQGVHIYKKKGNGFVKEHKFGKDATSPISFRDILYEDINSVWCATEMGLYNYDQKKESMTHYGPPGEKDMEISSVAMFGRDTLLVAGKNSGLYFFDIAKKIFLSNIKPDITNPHSLSSGNIAKIYLDKDKGIWLSLPGIGIDFFYLEKSKFGYFKIIDTDDKTSLDAMPIPTGIIEDASGNIWCATMSNGLYVLDKNKKIIRHHIAENAKHEDLPSNNIISIYRDQQQRNWIMTWEGIALYYPNGQFQVIKNDSLDFLRMYQLDDGRLLLSCFNGGIYEIKETGHGHFEVGPISGISSIDVYTTLWQSSEGLLYACRDVSEIAIMDPSSEFKVVGTIPISGESDAFYENPRDGSIWIANSSGLVRFEKGRIDGKGLRIFTEKDGLPDRVVYGILPDGDSILWLSTNRGLASFRLDNFQVKRYGIADGLSSLANNSLAFLKTGDGEMLFGTSKGVTNFFPQNIKPYRIKARPVITRILINDEENPALVKGGDGAANVTVVRDLTLPYENNTISFYFAALEYSDPQNVNFRYKMDGVDNDWVESGTQNFARYSKIGVGDFTFKLMASNSDGEWSRPITLAISVTPPFTQTPLFYCMAMASFVGIVWLYFNSRRKRHEERMQLETEKREALEQERQRIARDVHDDLGSGLSALSLQTAIAQYRTTPEEIKSELEKIDQTARDLSGKIKEVIWTVSAKNDTVANLISYLNQYAVDLLENTDLDVSVNLPEDIPEVTLTGEYRRTTFLAFKEALNNVIKHAKATQLYINFIVGPDNMQVEVADNGIGFDPQLLLASTGNGLLNMQTRMRDIGGDCYFKTSNQGSKVTFLLVLYPI